ncbi:hypothetical protein [Algicola sagamiensis]|uniref:hypothetical protein n=1 Tax=Algicola sagamiensis TaxID=163869 RepID=UPI00036D9CAD|nr:hypothetical protein [Algicola sagamiensis]
MYEFQPYGQKNKCKNILGYCDTDTEIILLFNRGRMYRYAKAAIGDAKVQEMLSYADKGWGLHEFVTRDPVLRANEEHVKID